MHKIDLPFMSEPGTLRPNTNNSSPAFLLHSQKEGKPLAGRDSFQKRQKEAARREKRQSKLDRRQGRQNPHADSTSEGTDAELGGDQVTSNDETPLLKTEEDVLKQLLEPRQTDNPPREP